MVVESPSKSRRGRTPVDHTGQRFGRLVAVSFAGRKVNQNDPRKCANALWRCRCDCGKESVVVARSLVDGSTRSCGCYWKESARLRGGQNRLTAGQSAFNQLLGAYRKSARQRGYLFSLSAEEFRLLTTQPCFYCGAAPETKYRAAPGTNGDYVGNGVDRVDNALGYEMSNVRACCKQCNIAKGSLSEADFLAWARQLVARTESREG